MILTAATVTGSPPGPGLLPAGLGVADVKIASRVSENLREGEPTTVAMESPLPEPARASETAYTLQQPGRLLDALEACMADRLSPGRSGWSAAEHLGHDLERLYGVRAPAPVIDRALRDLSKHRRVQRKVDAAGVLWYRLRTG